MLMSAMAGEVFGLADFNFGAVGDWGCSSNAQNIKNGISSKNPERVLGLGDYSYTSTATCWTNILQSSLPHQLLTALQR